MQVYSTDAELSELTHAWNNDLLTQEPLTDTTIQLVHVCVGTFYYTFALRQLLLWFANQLMDSTPANQTMSYYAVEATPSRPSLPSSRDPVPFSALLDMMRMDSKFTDNFAGHYSDCLAATMFLVDIIMADGEQSQWCYAPNTAVRLIDFMAAYASVDAAELMAEYTKSNTVFQLDIELVKELRDMNVKSIKLVPQIGASAYTLSEPTALADQDAVFRALWVAKALWDASPNVHRMYAIMDQTSVDDIRTTDLAQFANINGVTFEARAAGLDVLGLLTNAIKVPTSLHWEMYAKLVAQLQSTRTTVRALLWPWHQSAFVFVEPHKWIVVHYKIMPHIQVILSWANHIRTVPPFTA